MNVQDLITYLKTLPVDTNVTCYDERYSDSGIHYVRVAVTVARHMVMSRRCARPMEYSLQSNSLNIG